MRRLLYLLFTVVAVVGCHKNLDVDPFNRHTVTKHAETEQDRYENLNPWDDITKTEDIIGVYINGQKTLSAPSPEKVWLQHHTPEVSCKIWDTNVIIDGTITESAYWRGYMQIIVPIDSLKLKKDIPAHVVRLDRLYQDKPDTMSTASVRFDSVAKKIQVPL